MAAILLVTGPSGAGKTTTSKEFLKQADGVWAYINQDDIRQLVKAGYASADDYEKNWSEETRRQWDVSIPICIDIAKRYQEVGIHVLIDFFGPPDEFESWKNLLGDKPYKVVVLRPSEEATVKRNEARDSLGRLAENKIRQNYYRFDEILPGAIVIDSTRANVSEVVTKILEILVGSIAAR